MRRLFNFDRGLLGVGVGGPLADLHALMSTTLIAGFKKGLWELAPEISPAPAIDVVARIAENLSRTILGFQGDVLRKSLQEALLDAAGTGYDPDGPDLEVGLSKFLAKKGTKGFLELFLSRYLFNAVWIRIQEAGQLQMDQRLFTTAMNELEALCRSLVKTVLDEWESNGKLDRLEHNSQIAEALISQLEDSFLQSSRNKEGEPARKPSLPREAPRSVRTMAATVVQDSFAHKRTPGFRGSSAASQQILLQASDLNIFLKIFASGDNRALLGQLVHRSVELWVPRPKVHLIGQASEILSTPVDQLGEFRFKHVPKGPLRLQVDIPPDLRVLGDFVVSLES